MAAVTGQVEGFEGEGEVADEGVVEGLGAGAVELDVVGRPADSERVASGGQLADEVGEAPVVGVTAGFGAENGDRVVGDLLPVMEELGRLWVQEDEPGHVRRACQVAEHRRVQGVAEGVGAQDVEATVADIGRDSGHGVQDSLDGWAYPLLAGSAADRASPVGGADQVEQVGPFGLVELQGPGDAFEDVFGRTVGVSAFEAGVVLDADAGQHGHLFSAQAGHAAPGPIGGQSGLVRGNLGPPRSQELPDVIPRLHTLHGRGVRAGYGVPANTPIKPVSLAVSERGSVGWVANENVHERVSIMRAAVFNGPGSVEVAERPDPVIKEPTDAVVRVVLACVCGSDLWYWRGESDHAVGSIGHEFIGIVEEIGTEVGGVAVGDLVIAPFIFSDMSCPHCLNGSTISCARGDNFGNGVIDGGQGEAVRVPLAGSTLVPVSGSGHSDETLKSLLSLSDVMATGHHAAVCAGVKPGDTVAVVGDGAVGLCAVVASKRLGAERIIALSRHPQRQKLALEFGATDIIEERGDAAIHAVLDLTAGIGADAALECVGTAQSIATAGAIARPGSTVGIVGVPHSEIPFVDTFFRNIGWKGGPAPARIYIPGLLTDVLEGSINPGLVFDYETDLDHVADAYEAMDDRRAVKSLIRLEP